MTAALNPRELVAALALALALLLPGLAVGQNEAALSSLQKAQREIGRAEQASRQALLIGQHADFATASARNPEAEDLLSRAQRLLRFAKDGLAKAEQNQSETGFSDAALLARRASRQFEAYEDQVRETLAEIAAERAPKPEPVVDEPPPEPEAEAPEVPPEASGDEIERPDPSSGGDSVTIPRAPSSGGGRSEPTSQEPAGAESTAVEEPGALEASPVEERSSELERVEAPPPPPPPVAPRRPTGPPAALRRAVDAFFAGNYQQTVELLTDPIRGRSAARAQGLLFRAAARYALFLLGSETDYGLRGQALEDVIACRREDPKLEPNTEAFSPRFRDFFASAQ